MTRRTNDDDPGDRRDGGCHDRGGQERGVPPSVVRARRGDAGAGDGADLHPCQEQARTLDELRTG